MFKSIVVPLDGTAFGERALPVAVRIGRAHGAALHFVHVHALTPPGMSIAGRSASALDGVRDWSGWHDTEVREREKEYLAQVAERVDKAIPAATFELSLAVSLTEGLRAFAESWNADLIVMATHRSTPYEKILFGTNGRRVVRDLRLPTILVPSDDYDRPGATQPTLRTILVPLDGSSFAEEVLDTAVQTARGMGAEIVLLGVANPANEQDAVATPPRGAFPNAPEAMFPLDGYLADVERELRLAGSRVTSRIVRSNDAAAAILEHAVANAVDLIASLRTPAARPASSERESRTELYARVGVPYCSFTHSFNRTAWIEHPKPPNIHNRGYHEETDTGGVGSGPARVFRSQHRATRRTRGGFARVRRPDPRALVQAERNCI